MEPIGKLGDAAVLQLDPETTAELRARGVINDTTLALLEINDEGPGQLRYLIPDNVKFKEGRSGLERVEIKEAIALHFAFINVIEAAAGEDCASITHGGDLGVLCL